MSVDKLSQAVDHDVRAQSKGLDADRGSKSVVHHQQSILCMSDIGKLSDIAKTVCRVARHLGI